MTKKFSRRDVLKGLAAIGLISTARVERLIAQTTSAPLRTVFLPLQHGWGISGTSNRFMSGDQFNFFFPNGLDPFNSIREHCTVIDGLLTLGHFGNNHDLSYADILTAGVPMFEESSAFDSHMPLSVNESIDYAIEQHTNKPAFRFSAGYRSWGVPYHPLSFDTNSAVLPYYTSAFDAYNSLFANLPDDPESPEAQREAALVNSVLDFVRKPAEADLSKLSSSERDKMTAYLGAVDHLKAKKDAAQQGGNASLDIDPSQWQDDLVDLEHFLRMVEVGFANNMTQTAVVGIGDIHSISDFHHDHAHSNSNTWWNTRRDFANSVVTFVNNLAAITDFDGNSLLDNTLVVLTGEVGDGEHNVVSKGHILIGGANHIQTGRLIQPAPVQGRDNIMALRREDINGTLQQQIQWGDFHSIRAGARTNADLFREIANLSGMSLNSFGLSSQNKGSILS